jgi:hypothetical protein
MSQLLVAKWRDGVDTVEKVFSGWETKFSTAADAFHARRREEPRRLSAKDHGASYRHCEASQSWSRPKIEFCEILDVVRFSTFSTVSVNFCRDCTKSARLKDS